MLLPRLIPCLDLRDGRVVKGVRFEGIRDVGDPVELAAAYAESGADEIVLLDIAATRRGRGATVEVVSRVRSKVDIPLTVGGGVNGVDSASDLFQAGEKHAATSSRTSEAQRASSRVPNEPDTSGWNWQARTESRSSAAMNRPPSSLQAARHPDGTSR